MVQEVNEPILVVSNKLGVCRVDPAGKECSTTFTRLSFNGSSSVVKCACVCVHHNHSYYYVHSVIIIIGCPKTGRMHQIRVHLQWLGMYYNMHRNKHDYIIIPMVL